MNHLPAGVDWPELAYARAALDELNDQKPIGYVACTLKVGQDVLDAAGVPRAHDMDKPKIQAKCREVFGFDFFVCEHIGEGQILIADVSALTPPLSVDEFVPGWIAAGRSFIEPETAISPDPVEKDEETL